MELTLCCNAMMQWSYEYAFPHYLPPCHQVVLLHLSHRPYTALASLSYLQGVLYPVGEILHGARPVALLRRVLGGGVGLGQVRKDHLHISLGALCP